jgi:hypothetical protein
MKNKTAVRAKLRTSRVCNLAREAGRCGAALLILTIGTFAQPQNSEVHVDNDDIGGVVTSTKGREAGVWVIAETKDLPTKFAKIVVTDHLGRYVIPDLPKAGYSLWVRGYGLVDSTKIQTLPGRIVNLTAVVAPTARAAAEYYPASYWFSLIKVPDKNEFPGTGSKGNGISPSMKNQGVWLSFLKSGQAASCWACHQLGNKATREIPKTLGNFDSSVLAWDRRVHSGQAGATMVGGIGRFGAERALAMFANWTDRIAAGELPPAPPRPVGVERNVVITEWDWADEKTYLHDEIATDKRHPTVNAYGPIYGSPELSTDRLPVLDPIRHTTSWIPVPVRDQNARVVSGTVVQPSPYWGNEAIWTSKTNVHNVMLDQKGRLWLTSRIRNESNPAFCKEGSNPSAKLFAVETSVRQLAVYDPRTKEMKTIDTCFTTHHLQFAEDSSDTLWTSSCAPSCGGDTRVVGWLNTKMWDETHDEKSSAGWTAIILDTNGNGKRDAYVEPDQPIDPTKDKRIDASFYGVIPSPVDSSVWGAVLGFPGAIIRLNPGPNPPSTALSEIYEPPWGNENAPIQGFSPRGLDIDRNGVVWTVLASGHFASFDRRKCRGPLNGPTANGQHCPEGWTLYPFPAPQLKGVTDSGSAEASYYDWVDQFDTFGLGENVPIATGNGEEALMALSNGKWVVLRVPYPLGFYAKGLDGRIDDSKAGWKGKGLWSTYGTRTPFHTETGKGTTSKVLHFQLRPNPLAN